MSRPRPVSIVHYWAGCPQTPNSKWRRFLEVVRRCEMRGWRTHLVWSRIPDDPALVRPFIQAGCEIILGQRSRGEFDLRSILRVASMCRRLQCKIFHCHNDHTSPLIGAALARVPVRIWSKLAMSPYYERSASPKGWHRLFPGLRVSGALAHCVIAVSTAVKDELVTQGVSARKVCVLRLPVDVDRYARAVGNGIREALGLAANDFVITSVGRAIPVKGWDVLIRAFGSIAGRVPTARLLLVGSVDGQEQNTFAEGLKGLATATGMASRIIFAGVRDDVPDILAGSDLFVMPSRSEGLPQALLEALAAGLPCIAARVGGIPDVIVDGDTGLLFRREDVEELGRLMEAAISNRGHRARLSRNGQQRAQAFGIKSYVDALFRHYDDLMGRRA